MKNIYFFFFSVVLALSCSDDSTHTPTQVTKDGVIVWQKPLWSVPHDTAYYLTSILKPYYEFDGKVIVDTYKHQKGGLRCMEIETGRVIWEQYFNSSTDPLGAESFTVKESFFNPQEEFLIISIGGWGEKEHIKLNVQTGEIIWRLSIESFNSMEPYGDHYYCTVWSAEDVRPIYKVDIKTGKAEFYYETDLPFHPDYNAQLSNWVLPFEFNGRELLFISQMQMTSPASANYYFCLMDASTKERLLKQVEIEHPINKVEVKDGEIFVFTGSGYKIFNMETLTFERDVRLIDRGEYTYHTFYKNKLIVGLSPNNTLNANGHYVVDIDTHNLMYIFEAWPSPSAIMDNIIYIPSTGSPSLKGYNINTGDCVMNIELDYNAQFSTATYKNKEGKKFVVVGDIGFTYCYEAI